MGEQIFKVCTGDCPSCKRMGFEYHYVPVEPCEHGMIDGHPLVGQYENGIWLTMLDMEWCPGAGVGGDDECPNGCDPGCQCHD